MKSVKLNFFLAIALIFFMSEVSAAGLLSLSRGITMPAQVVVNTEAIAQYTVTNNAGFDLSAVRLNLPSDVTQATGSGLCNFPAPLANGASCTLRLKYNASVVGAQFIDDTFSVCPDNSGTYCSAIPTASAQTSVVVAAPTTDMPNLSVETNTITLSPAQTTYVTMTNTSASVTANDVKIYLPSTISPYVSSSSTFSCDTLNPGASCTLSIISNSNLPSSINGKTLSVAGSNTHAVNLTASYNAYNVSASNIGFTAPGTQEMTITNRTGQSITVNSVSLTSGIQNISVASIPANCTNLTTGSSCVISLTATTNSYGSGNATVTYTTAAQQSSTTVDTVSVAQTNVVINPNSSNQGQDISGDTHLGSGSFIIKNIGKFNWISPTMSRSASDAWLTLSGCSSAVAPGDSCTVSYTMTFPNDAASVVTASGDNVNDTAQNFAPDELISMGLDGATSHLHLLYRAIKITNLTNNTVTLSHVSQTAPITDKIIVCDSTGSNCSSHFASDCLTTNEQLTAGVSCRIWYRALDAGALNAGQTTEVTVSATATSGGTSNPLTHPFTFTYGEDLYATGSFAYSDGGATLLIGVARWDGASWHAMGNNSTVGSGGWAWALYHGDLYGGGYLSLLGGVETDSIAKWNGDNWSALDTNAAYNGGIYDTQFNEPGSVYALYTLNDKLYAGGSFTDAGDTTTPNIAQWNGSTWSSVGGGSPNSLIYAFASNSASLLYAGRDGNAVDGRTGVAVWDGTNWSAIGPAADYSIYGFALLNDDLYSVGNFHTGELGVFEWDGNNWSDLISTPPISIGNVLLNFNSKLIVGGDFTTISGTAANYIAQWSGSGTTWSALGSELDGQVFALANLGTDLYVGGSFSTLTAGGSPAPGIAKWNGSSWSALGSGLDGPGGPNTQALTIAPRLNISSD